MLTVAHLNHRLHDATLTHDERVRIGEQLHVLSQTCPGVGLRPDGLPDIDWCAVDVSTNLRGVRMPFRNERGMVYGEFALQPFFIARYPITYQQFRAFQLVPDGFNDDRWWEGLTAGYHRQAILDPCTPLDNHPRDSVSWYQAVAFSRWLNARLNHDDQHEIRLPTEWEWQWAAQGSAAPTYPWGEWDGRFANTREARLGQTTAVGIYPQGATWCGALDMSGNVWEWCLNEYKTPAHTGCEGHNPRVLRGGSRFNDLPNRRLDYFGFRLVCGTKLD